MGPRAQYQQFEGFVACVRNGKTIEVFVPTNRGRVGPQDTEDPNHSGEPQKCWASRGLVAAFCTELGTGSI
jgi:hypothetical protein